MDALEHQRYLAISPPKEKREPTAIFQRMIEIDKFYTDIFKSLKEQENSLILDSTSSIDNYVIELESALAELLSTNQSEILSYSPNLYKLALNSIQFRLPVHSNRHLGKLSNLKSQLIVSDLKRYRLPRGFEFKATCRGKIRYGLLCKHLRLDPETRAIPGYLPSKCDKNIEAIILAFEDEINPHLKIIIQNLDVKVVRLPNNLGEIVKIIRSFSLDGIFFMNDASAKYSTYSQLAFFRLARCSMVGVSSIMPIHSNEIDKIFVGEYLSRSPSVTEYTSPLVGGDHAGFSFLENAIDSQARPTPCTDFNKKIIRLISGSNYWKISTNVIKVWAEVLLKLPEAMLSLSPFPPHYSAANSHIFVSQVLELFKQFDICSSRVTFLPPAGSISKWHEQLQYSDLYLDSFPYSSLTTIHDAITANLPVVTMNGQFLRNRHAASILNQLRLDIFIACSEDDYVDKALTLATNTHSRVFFQDLAVNNKRRLSDTPRYYENFISTMLS
jgi:hypothetical protein